MGKILKHLKPHIFAIICIVTFLLIQAVSDLSLPDYMSDIVNVGIQQGGIKNAVPEVIRKSEMDKITLFMSKEDKAKVISNYTLIKKDKLSQGDLDKYSKDYPEIKSNDVYTLNTEDETVIEELNAIIGKPILIVAGLEKDGIKALQMVGQTSTDSQVNPTVEKPQGQSEMPQGASEADISQSLANIPEGTDPFLLLSKLPKEQLKGMQKAIDEKFAEMPESMITQGAVSYVEAEYDALGRDTGKLQSNYILYAGFLMLLIALVGMAASVIVGFIAARVSARIGQSLRKDVFENVVGFSNTEFDKFSTSSLITRSTNDIQQVQTLMVMLLRIVFYAPILGIGGVIKVLNTDTSMSWVIGVAVLAIMSLVLVLFGVAMPKFKIMQKLVDKLNLVTRESLTGMLVIRAFGTERNEEKKFEIANKDFTSNNLFVSRVMAIMMPMMMLVMNGVILLIV